MKKYNNLNKAIRVAAKKPGRIVKSYGLPSVAMTALEYDKACRQGKIWYQVEPRNNS